MKRLKYVGGRGNNMRMCTCMYIMCLLRVQSIESETAKDQRRERIEERKETAIYRVASSNGQRQSV